MPKRNRCNCAGANPVSNGALSLLPLPTRARHVCQGARRHLRLAQLGPREECDGAGYRHPAGAVLVIFGVIRHGDLTLLRPPRDRAGVRPGELAVGRVIANGSLGQRMLEQRQL
jgi:hypothetical protein